MRSDSGITTPVSPVLEAARRERESWEEVRAVLSLSPSSPVSAAIPYSEAGRGGHRNLGAALEAGRRRREPHFC